MSRRGRGRERRTRSEGSTYIILPGEQVDMAPGERSVGDGWEFLGLRLVYTLDGWREDRRPRPRHLADITCPGCGRPPAEVQERHRVWARAEAESRGAVFFEG